MNMGNRFARLALSICTLLALAGSFSVALAQHPGEWNGSIGGVGEGYAVEVSHADQTPFKGPFTVTVTNTGNAPWGDFHFGIFDPIGGQDISNVGFLDTSMGGEDPTSSQSGLTWIINNVVVGATIDLFYCSDPVMPGETAWFTVYTDNPDSLAFFGVLFYPTPVPPSGACCQPDGSCTYTCQYDCTGEWLGPGTDCDPNPCPQPPGACCFADGACLVLTEGECVAQQGTWLGLDTDCDPNPCPIVPIESRSWGQIKSVYR